MRRLLATNVNVSPRNGKAQAQMWRGHCRTRFNGRFNVSTLREINPHGNSCSMLYLCIGSIFIIRVFLNALGNYTFNDEISLIEITVMGPRNYERNVKIANSNKNQRIFSMNYTGVAM